MELKKIGQRIYQDHFHKEDEGLDGNVTVFSEGAPEVLKAMAGLENNPELLDYIVKCLARIGIAIRPGMCYLVIHKEHYDNYPPLAYIQRMEGKPKHIEDIVINKVFNGYGEALEYAEKGEIDWRDISHTLTKPESLLFEKYSIKTIQ